MVFSLRAVFDGDDLDGDVFYGVVSTLGIYFELVMFEPAFSTYCIRMQ